MTGELFEVNVASLLFIRGMFETESFHLATNVDQAGAFDDLIFKFKDSCTQLEHTYFMQLKTKMEKLIKFKDLTALTGDFSLLKYYASYCDIQEEFSTQTDSVIFGDSFENCEFIIYTNTKLESHDSWYEIPASGNPENMLYCGGNCGKISSLLPDSKESSAAFRILEAYEKQLHDILVGKFTLTEIKQKLEEFRQLQWCYQLLKIHKKEEIFNKLLNNQLRRIGDRAKWELFLKKLKVYTCQAIEGDLEAIVKQSLQTFCSTSDSITQDIYTKMKEAMIEWWRKGVFFLTQCHAPFWRTIMDNRMSELVAPICGKISEIAGISFQDTLDISHEGQITHIVTPGTTRLSCLKVLQNLVGIGHIMIDIRTLENHLSEVLAVWKRGWWCSMLIVEGGIDRLDVSTGVADVLSSCPEKKLVLISSYSSDMINKLCKTFKSKTYIDDNSFCFLDKESQNSLLQCKVNFQGYFVSLKSLTGIEGLQDAVTTDTAVQLLTGKLKVGLEVDAVDVCYIPRTLLRRECVDKSILTVKACDHFLVSGISLEELQHLVPSSENVSKFEGLGDPNKCRYFVSDSPRDFRTLCRRSPNVHWIHKEEEKLIWKLSSGEISLIRSYILQDTDYVQYSTVQQLLNLPHQVVLVIAEPGMGKSTELSHLASEIKLVDPATWVVRVDLNDQTDLLRESSVSAIELLASAGKFVSVFDRVLLEHQMSCGGNMVVMFDGFDEISPNYTEKVLQLLRDLASTKIKKVFVTSRLVMKERLEKELSVLPFEFRPFSETDQRKFMLRLWEGMVAGVYNLSNFVSELLKLIANSIKDRLSTFTGIPLQIKMVSEAFCNEAELYCKTGEIKLPQKLDVLQLYTRFVTSKWEIYYAKNKVDITKAGLSGDYEDLKEMFRVNYMHCALFALLDGDEIKKLHNSKNIIKKVQTFIAKFRIGRDKTGIIIEVRNDVPVFAHRTFAEYFVAMWFSETFHSVRDFLRSHIFLQNFQVIFNFLNRILGNEFELHIAVLNLDKDSVLTFLAERKIDVDTRDEGGRTALHLAVMNYADKIDDETSKGVTKEILQILFDHGSDPGIEDDVLRWRPLRMADCIRAWAAVDLLLGKKADSSDLILTRQNICNDQFRQEVLSVAASQGFVELTDFLLNCGVEVGSSISVRYGETFTESECNATMLHEASRNGHLRLVEYLINCGSDLETKDTGTYKRTPLMWAAHCGQLQVLEYLIKCGASVCCRDVHGKTALLIAATNGKLNVVKFFTPHSYMTECDTFGNNIMRFATQSGNIELVMHLLECGLDGNFRNYKRQNPLMFVAQMGLLDVAKLLLRYTDVTALDDYGNSVLQYAACSSEVQLLILLLDAGLDINCCNNKGQTPLFFSALTGQFRATQLLCERGADLHLAECENWQTPLHVAAEGGHLSVVKCLVHYGASLTAYDKNMNTPYDFAMKYNKFGVVRLLEDLIALVCVCPYTVLGVDTE